MNNYNTVQITWCVFGSTFIVILLFLLTSLIIQCCANDSNVIMNELIPLLNTQGYEYWLDWGTLLGARREGEMIPHDYDADIGMVENEFQRLKKDWNTKFYTRLHLRRENKQLYRIRFRLGWVDIFRYDEHSDGILDMRSMGNDSHSCKCIRGHRIHRDFIFPLTKYNFGSVQGKAPNHTDEYLEHLYGKNWRIPIKNSVSRLIYWR